MTALQRDLEVRPPSSDDARAMAAAMVTGNNTHRAWAPRSWQPPGLERTQAQWHLRLREDDRWSRVAIGREGDLMALASCPEHGEAGHTRPPCGRGPMLRPAVSTSAAVGGWTAGSAEAASFGARWWATRSTCSPIRFI